MKKIKLLLFLLFTFNLLFTMPIKEKGMQINVGLGYSGWDTHFMWD